MRNVDLNPPTLFLDHVYLGCIQRECKPNEAVVFCWRCKIPEWEQPHAKTVAWSNVMEGHAEKCVERHCELENQKIEQLYKMSSLCLDDHHVKTEELESVGELFAVKLHWNACILHELVSQTSYAQ